MSTEREIKLRFGSPAEARAAVIGAGAVPLRPRRLQHDCLLDTPDGTLREAGSVIRVRDENGTSFLTFKGPVVPAAVKVREELETPVASAVVIREILERLGYAVWFRYEKYREEFRRDALIVAVDETPVGTFVELEGSELEIRRMAEALGRAPADYVLDSYRRLFARHCEAHGIDSTDMVFERP